MGRLATIAITKLNGSVITSENILFNADKIRTMKTQGSVVVVTGDRLDDTKLLIAESPTAIATIATELNTANTTNPADLTIPLTVLNADGSSTNAPGVKYYNTKDIYSVRIHPSLSTDSLVAVENAAQTGFDYLRVDETQAAIKALANA